jgi:uncharacterized protein
MMDLKMAAYIKTARVRAEARRQRQEARRLQAWALAQRAAELLHREFGAERVVVFGSTLMRDRFHERSDLDLAVWGLDDRVYLRALARLLALDLTLEVDLVEAEQARGGLLAIIEREGVEL